VEPAYLETDASWCEPGGEASSPLANGGAFGAKLDSVAPTAARALADEHGQAVLVVLSREDTVRLGAKRPPVSGGARADGTGVMRVVRTPGVVEAIAAVAPGLVVEEVDVPGPPTSLSIRAAGWAEAVVLLAGAGAIDGPVVSPDGATATAVVDDDGIHVSVRCGRPLDGTVLRSYCVGAAHMAWSWVTSEALSVDGGGIVHDLTVRSFGVVRATDTPPISVVIVEDDGEPVNGSDAVFAAVAAATWRHRGCPEELPTG
jgi:CO/xanthine dehydrogenase Mo-binding subunit